MLVLGRKEGESILIGDDVVVMVTAVYDRSGRRLYGAKVSLGIAAPLDMPIDRDDRPLAELLAK